MSSVVSQQAEQEEHLHDDVSAITSPTTAINNNSQCTTDTIGDRMTRRQRINSIISSIRKINPPNALYLPLRLPPYAVLNLIRTPIHVPSTMPLIYWNTPIVLWTWDHSQVITNQWKKFRL
jgi:hypothetical protein